MRTKNWRRSPRTICAMPVVVAWTDDTGSDRVTRGHCIEVSETGLRLKLSQPIPFLSFVILRLERAGLAVSGRVRHVRRQGLDAIVGLELRHNLSREIIDTLVSRPLASGLDDKHRAN